MSAASPPPQRLLHGIVGWLWRKSTTLLVVLAYANLLLCLAVHAGLLFGVDLDLGLGDFGFEFESPAASAQHASTSTSSSSKSTPWLLPILKLASSLWLVP